MTPSWRCWWWQLGKASSLAIAGAIIAASGDCAKAQITPDGTLGAESSVVTPLAPGSPVDVIQGGATRGANLFHSFEQFSVPTGGGAYFNNAADIQNIISRVTGSSISNIDGLLRANGTANLFLLNPNGIIFGSNASLNIGGSFLGSTASSLNFADGTQFGATAPQTTPLLTVSVPIGLQIGANPGSIVNQARAIDSNGRLAGLQVLSGQSIALVGGDINLEGGGLSALGGRVELGGLAGAGTVGLAVNGNTLSLSFPPDITRANVTLADDAQVSVQGVGGGDIFVNANNFTATNGGSLVAGTQGAGNGGDITINANSISISGRGANVGSGLRNQALPGSSGNLGDIRINAKNISLLGAIGIEDDGSETGLHNQAFSGSWGNAGNIFVNAEYISASSGALVRSLTYGSSNAGNVVVSAQDVDLSGLSGIESATFGQGSGGNVTINTGRLTVRDGAVVGALTFGQGSAGSVTVNALESVEMKGSSSGLIVDNNPGSSGNGGDLTITTRNLILQDGASVFTGAFGEGSGGTITVNATDISIESGSSLSALVGGSGDPGDVTINTRNLILRDGASVFAGASEGSGAGGGTITVNATDISVESGSILSALTDGSDDAGNITITTGRLSVRDGGRVLASNLGSSGNGGFLTIHASEVEVIGENAPGTDGSFSSNLSVSTSGAGDGGTLTIETERLIVRDGAEISAATLGKGNAGDLMIRATDVQLIGESTNGLPGGLLAYVGEDGNGGNVTVETGRLSIRDGAEISAATLGGGNAGNVTIRASEVELNRARVNVSAQSSGNAGNLDVTAGDLRLDNRGILTARSATGKGGNIRLQARDLLLLRRNSLIEAVSGNRSGNGLDGNININTKFLVAVPSENNDIVATGFGRSIGSNIRVSAQGVFGTQFREQLTPDSEIVATGRVVLNTPDVDPSQGLATLPAELVEASELIATGCAADGENKFIVTGRGGLPPNPGDILNGEAVLTNWATLAPEVENRSGATPATNPTRVSAPTQIVEAQGWVINNKGEVVLTAQTPTVTPNIPWLTPATCHTP